WNRVPLGERDVRAAHAPFSESGSSAPTKLEDAIGPSAIAMTGMSVATRRPPRSRPTIRSWRSVRCRSTRFIGSLMHFPRDDVAVVGELPDERIDLSSD